MQSKAYLQSQIRSVGIAYLLGFFVGAHYAYLGKWGWQILFWLTGGGLGIWAFFDIFTIPGKVNRYNKKIFQQIDAIEREERSQFVS